MDNPPPPAKVAKSSITADVSTAKKSDAVSSSSAATKRATTMPMSTTVIGTASNNAVPGINTSGRVAAAIPVAKVGAISNTSSIPQPQRPSTSTPFILTTTLTSGPAYWDSIKSKLLATTASTRSAALKILTELHTKKLGGGHEYAMSTTALLPALQKILVSPGGKAMLMLNAGKKEKKDKASKKKKKSEKDGKSDASGKGGGEKGEGKGGDSSMLHPPKSSKTPTVPPCYVLPSSNTTLLNQSLRHTSLLVLEQLASLIAPGKQKRGKQTSSSLSGCSELFRSNAPTIVSIAIHVIVEDYETNALLANGILMTILRGFKTLDSLVDNHSISEAGGKEGSPTFGTGKEGTKKLRECQVLLDYASECYKGWGKKSYLTKVFEYKPDKSVVGKVGWSASKAGGIVLASGTTPSKSAAAGAVSSAVKAAASTAPSSTTQSQTPSTLAFLQQVETPSTSAPAGASSSSTPSTPSSSRNSNVKSAQSFNLLTHLPQTIMALIQLHPKLITKNSPNLISCMMDYVKLPSPNPPVNPAKSASVESAKTPAKGGNPATPSLNTPQVATKGSGSVATPAIAAKTPSKSTPLQTPQTLLPPGMATPKPVTPQHLLDKYELQKRHYNTQSLSLLHSQIKALSFLVYLNKGSLGSEVMKNGSVGQQGYEDGIITGVLQLLRSCPREAIQLRKELLLSTRNILATDSKTGFFRHIDAFLDERLLIGSSPHSKPSSSRAYDRDPSSCAEASMVHSLGYTILAELIHNVRTKLASSQLSLVVRIFSRVLMHDTSIGTYSTSSSHNPAKMNNMTLQITSAKLLVHLIDVIFHNKDPNGQIGRDLLFRILVSFVSKFEIVSAAVDGLLQGAEGELNDRRKWQASMARRMRIDNGTGIDEDEEDYVFKEFPTNDNNSISKLRDVQQLLRPMIHGMKTVFWCISSYSHQREKEQARSTQAGEEEFPLPAYALARENEEVCSAPSKMTRGERELVKQFVRYGLPCLRVFTVNMAELDKELLSNKISTSLITEGKASKKKNQKHREILESFAVSFTSLESFNFRSVLAPNLSFLIKQMTHDEDGIVIIFSHLLLTTGKAVSYEFFDVLMQYLMDNIEALGEYEKTGEAKRTPPPSAPTSTLLQSSPPPPNLTKNAQHHSRIFSLTLSSILKHPRNEAALLPHLQTLVKECIQRSTEGVWTGACWPGPYLNLLRAMFRTLSSAKFEHSYKELIPLLPTVLNGLYRYYLSTTTPSFRRVIIELCLTFPCRLSTLLPHLSLITEFVRAALQSNTGDLINLGLRTLEFWVDNLHPDYLYPVLSSNRDKMCELMLALTSHLQPAPYPYGLLCMRLLGKLGGVSRLFLGEMNGFKRRMEHTGLIRSEHGLGVHCAWAKGGDSEASIGSFHLPFPLAHAVEVLRCVAAAPPIVIGNDSTQPSSNSFAGKNFSALLSCDPRNLDLNQYSVDIMDETKKSQSRSGFDIIRAALASVLDIEDGDGGQQITISTSKLAANDSGADDTDLPMESDQNEKTPSPGDSLTPQQRQEYNNDFKLICDGLFAATVHDDLRDEAILLLKGLASHIFYLVTSHRSNVTRIDSDGCAIDPYHGGEDGFNDVEDNARFDMQNHISDGKLQPLKPFGCFRLSGSLEGALDPFVLNESMADAFTDEHVMDSHVAAAEVMLHWVDIFERAKGAVSAGTTSVEKAKPMDVEMKEEHPEGNSPKEAVSDVVKTPSQSSDTAWGNPIFENLLSNLCQICFSTPWNHRSGATAGLFEFITKMGQPWAQQYEVEILHTAMFVIKDTPDGIVHASEQSIHFFLQVSWFFFGGPASWKESGTLVHDVLCPTMSTKPAKLSESEAEASSSIPPISVKKASLTLILSEIASTKPLVRFGVRHVLRMITRDSDTTDQLLADHVSSLKRLLFPKLLRTLPLPNQVAAVDTIAFILHQAPKLIPITDQNLLAFLSELLKMISLADGEFSDTSFGSVVLIDKNGFAVNNGGETISPMKTTVQPSSLFLRRAIIAEDDSFGGCIQVPAELPLGVQLRVSTLLLFRGLIRGFANEFYDAESQSKIGNIRPHVVALLFRSLISEPPEAVTSSASALHTALTLCQEQNSKQSRLPKELIQSCIRPILMNLRDYTKLTIPLLRGLSRLLGLLSSWFNKTLGEKLLEHLHKFADAENIIASQLWKPGEEPLIAAAVMNLFSLLPSASQFVESLVKYTGRIESVLPRYKPCLSSSPFREPLAKYLNRHCASTVKFFLESHRLRNPFYSSIFQDMLKRDDCANLRKYLMVTVTPAMLSNVCFEVPLAILRSEKTSTSEGKPPTSSLAVYGINGWNSPTSQRKLEVARQDIDTKKKFFNMKTQEVAKAQKLLQSKEADDPKISEYRSAVKAARGAVERAKRELEERRSNYVRDVSQAGPRPDVDTAEQQMNVSALELQHQGFKIVETLASLHPQYLENQDEIVRALRWLWRSRGRHYRLLHEEEIPPRYQCESLALGKLLVSYAKANLGDIDALFDSIRVFLQPQSSVDFSFIKQFLLDTVSCADDDHKVVIIQRFTTLLGSDGSEETKTISAEMLTIPLLKHSTTKALFTDPCINLLLKSLLRESSYGSKLAAEYLQIIDILLERMPPGRLTDYRKELLKFIWNHLKLNDATTKYHGYLAVSRFIATFETPSKVVLQVYRSLLRDTFEKDTTKALNLLIPSLSKRLDDKELDSAVQYATKLMCEEGDSVPLMSHLWTTILSHKTVYQSKKSAILKRVPPTLSLLGLQPNAPPEQVKLSVSVVKLLVDWTSGGQPSIEQSQSESTQPYHLSLVELEQAVIDSTLNSLIKIAFINAESKSDQVHQQIEAQIFQLIKVFLLSGKKCNISPDPFGNVLEGSQGESGEKKSRSNFHSIRKESGDSTSSGNEKIKAHFPLCVEILQILVRHDPKNEFLESYLCPLLSQFLDHLAWTDTQILEDLIIHLLIDGHVNSETISHIITMLENILRQGDSSDQTFTVSVIERIWAVNQNFIEPLLGSLAVFAEGMAKEHANKVGRASNATAVQESGVNGVLPATPTLGILEAACNLGFKPAVKSKDVYPCNGGYKRQIVIENDELAISLRSLISVIRMLGSSNSLFTYSSTRQRFMSALSLILESSNSLPVLMSATSIVGKWLTVDPQQIPLTKSEREGFTARLSSLDFKHLSEISSQALIDTIGCIVLAACGSAPGHKTQHEKCVAYKVEGKAFQKLFSLGLMSANPRVRLLVMSAFLDHNSSMTTSGLPGDVLLQALTMDFEGVGKQLWTAIIADVLLASTHTQRVGNPPVAAHLSLSHGHDQSCGVTIDVRSGEYDGVYSSFAKILASEGDGGAIAGIRNLLQGDLTTCQSIFELSFSAAWKSLSSDAARASLIEPIGSLLSKPYHSQFLRARRGDSLNCIQSMLRLLVHLEPMPALDPFLLWSLGVNYSACSEALTLLESQYALLTAKGHDVDSPPHQVLIKTIQQCYESLEDRDLSIAISSATSSIAGTKFALSCDMYYFVNESTNAYMSLIDRASGNDAEFLPSESEMGLWEERWVDAHKELSQWGLIDEFASSTRNGSLMLECAWKTANFEKVKSITELPSVVASLEEGDPLTKMTEIYLAIHEGNLRNVENLHAQSAQLCLNKWQLLPSVGAGGSSHSSLLQQCQRLLELRESARIIEQASNHAARRSTPDMKVLLDSWRNRLPNSFEKVSQYNEIFLWRHQVFDAVTKQFQWADRNTVAALHDRPFSCISLGRAARKQGLKEVAAFSLGSMADCAMDVEYAFLKLREQVVSFQNSTPEQSKIGLNLVNTTNLAYFDAPQKSELFRLKAYFFNELNEKPKSNQAYCHAVQICPTYARAWIDWGRLCASLSDDTRRQAGDEKTESKELIKKTNLYLVQAMGCFLEAVRCDPSEQSRDHLPYCLSMLANDGATYGNLCRTFETRSAVLPAWVWLPYIPQLLSSLCRVEGQALKATLGSVLKDHPQALYYSLRSFYLERRDIERTKGQQTESSKSNDTSSSSRLAEEFMSSLRKAHPVLWIKLESILEDLIVRFRPSYEAELLHAIVALLQKASTNIKTSQLEACTKTLTMLGMKFFNFNKDKPDGSITRKAARFHTKYAALFKSDFLQNENAKAEDLVSKLQKWKAVLSLTISRVPSKSNLREISPSLSWFSSQAPDLWAGACESKSLTESNSKHDAPTSSDNALYKTKRSNALAAAKVSAQTVLVAANSEGLGGHTGGGAAVVEIPGQYAPTSSSVFDSRPFPELHAKLVGFKQTLELTSNSTKQHVHRITMIGSDGKTYNFLLQLAIPYWIRTDERSSQVQNVMGKALSADIGARRRCLSTRGAVVIPVAQRMRMSATDTSHHSLDSVLRHVQGPKSSTITAYFQEQVSVRLNNLGDMEGEQKAKAVADAKLEVYRDICQNRIPPNVLSKYMREIMPSPEHLFQFRRVFASQLAINSLLQHAFAVVERNPNRFVFCNASGRVLTQDFRSHYNHGLFEKHDVPFRMTRSIAEIIGPFLMEGVFIPSFATVSSAMHKKRTILEPILHLLLRDDVMSWYISKSSSKNDQKMQEVERQLSDRVWKNVRFVQGRFEECSLREVTDATAEAITPEPEPIDAKVRYLVDAATSEEKLSMMPSSYQAWL